MEKILYFDIVCGISGDMTLGALLDLGLDKDKFLKELSKLNISDEYEIKIHKKKDSGIEGTNVDVILKHHHDHEHEHDEHHHHHRHLEDIYKIIENSTIKENAKFLAKNIFMEIAMAEAKVHGTTIDKVHFHEVGATDSIVDIVGSAILIDMLGVDKIYSSSVPLGSGFVKCDHGIMPVPAPATLEILKGAKIKLTKIEGETTTPTGAAIVKSLSEDFKEDHEFEIQQIGYGMGKKKFEIPNMLRIVVGIKKQIDTVYEINANIDDMNGEIYSYLYEMLFNMGALDVYTQSIYMKKSRPAIKLSVICEKEKLDEITEFILKETTTLGIRYQKMNRSILERKIVKIKSKYGNVSVKFAYYNGKLLKHSPEYDECKVIAQSFKIPLKTVYEDINNVTIKYLETFNIK